MLTVEYNKIRKRIEIYCDSEGLEILINKLNSLKKNKGHTHLMTPSWAGYELTEEKQGGERNILINHLKIIMKSE